MPRFGFGRKRDPVPEWAPFFTRAQFERFTKDVRAYFRRAGSSVELAADAPRVNVTGGTFPQGQYGIMNLAQVCNQVDRGEWPKRVAEHFDSLVAAAQDHARFNVREAAFEQVKDVLAVRLGDEASLPADTLIARRDLPGTISYLVVDLPRSVESVPPEMPEKWGKPVDELFAIALENVNRTVNARVEQVEIRPGVSFTACTGDSFFTASLALLLDRLDGATGAHGTLVAVPHRHAMLFHRIETAEAIFAVQHLGILALNLDEQGPGSISPNLFWYRGGKFVDLPFRIENETFEFRPPEEFIAMMNGLPGGGSERGDAVKQ